MVHGEKTTIINALKRNTTILLVQIRLNTGNVINVINRHLDVNVNLLTPNPKLGGKNMNAEQLKLLEIACLKEGLLNQVIVWLKAKGLYNECMKDCNQEELMTK